jgi:hypothetical protein
LPCLGRSSPAAAHGPAFGSRVSDPPAATQERGDEGRADVRSAGPRAGRERKESGYQLEQVRGRGGFTTKPHASRRTAAGRWPPS